MKLQRLPTVASLLTDACASAKPRQEPLDGVTIECYEDSVPPFVEGELLRLYGSVFSSLAQFRVGGALPPGTSTFLARSGGKIVSLLLYRRLRARVQVLNEVARIGVDEMERFASHIFSRYPRVGVITFRAVESEQRVLSLVHQRYNCLENIAMHLPASEQEYLAALGKNTRRNIKRYGERLQRAFPSFEFKVFEAEDISSELIEQVVGFNRARMAGKRKTSVIDEQETERLLRIARSCGLVGVAIIDGEVCAGAISYRCGGNYVLDVLAHDPRYDEYWVGILCCYMTICACIARGGKEFHFLWGRYDYKFALGAQQRDLDEVFIYASRLHVLRNLDIALSAAWRSYRRRAKLMLEAGKRERSSSGGVFARALQTLRATRKFASRASGKG